MKDRIKVSLYNKTTKEIDMSDFKVIPDDFFADRRDVVKVELPEGVEVIGNNAFEGCSRLEEIILPSTLKRIGNEAFIDCINLVKAEYGAEVEVAANAFKGCKKLNK